MPARWLANTVVTIATSSGPENDVTFPDSANSPKNCVIRRGREADQQRARGGLQRPGREADDQADREKKRSAVEANSAPPATGGATGTKNRI